MSGRMDSSCGSHGLAVGVAAAWPTIHRFLWEGFDPISAIEAFLVRGRFLPVTESPVIAARLMFLPDSAAAFVPGLLALAATPVHRVEARPDPRRVVMWAIGVGLATVIVGAVTHLRRRPSVR